MFSAKKVMGAQKLICADITEIDPNPMQPRREFDEYELKKLAFSIKQNGLLQPITVRRKPDGRLQLVAGERRLRAVKMLEKRRINAILIKTEPDKAAILSLIENLQRRNLSIFEEAEGILKIINSFGLTGVEAAAELGMAASTLSNKLKILKLAPEERERILAARLSERHARALVRLSAEKRREALDRVIAEELTVRETEALVESILNPESEPKAVKKPPSAIEYAVKDMRIVANSIDRMVDSIKKSGVSAKAFKSETNAKIEYRIIINKPTKGKSDPVQLRMSDL